MDRARKLRASCDSCGAAKTRCDRAQPQCARCVSMNLACTYSPSRQLGKRPRRRLEISPRFADNNVASNNTTYHSPAIEAFDSNDSQSSLDPLLGTGITPPEDIQLPIAPEPSMVWPPLDNSLLGESHRCYHESVEILQLLTIPERLFSDDAPIVLDVSQILQANKRAVESLHRLVDCNCAKLRGHQTMLYASLISRVLWWYREAAGDEIYTSNGAVASCEAPSPDGSRETMVCGHSVLKMPENYFTLFNFEAHADCRYSDTTSTTKKC